jgi:hypothetical protein
MKNKIFLFVIILLSVISCTREYKDKEKELAQSHQTEAEQRRKDLEIAKEAGKQRIKIKAYNNDYWSFQIIEVDGKEFLVNCEGGIVPLNQENDN